MPLTLYSPSEIRDAAAHALPVEHHRFEIRLMSFVITLLFIGGCLQPVLLIMQGGHSLVAKLANVSHVPGVVAGLFMLSALAAVPHMWALLMFPESLSRKAPRKMATAGAALGSVLWLYLGNLSIPLDMTSWVFFAKAFACAMLVGGVYALSLNSQQVRQNEKPAIG